MVSQSHMDTISTISFWTLTICRFTGWWVTISSQCRFSAWSVNNLIFTIFALQEVSFQQWLKRTSLNETIFDAWTSVWAQFSFAAAAISREETIAVTISFFIDKAKQWPPTCQTTRMWLTMSTTWILDVSEPVPQLANTRTRWSWLTMKNVKSKSSEVLQWRQTMRSQTPGRSRRWSTSWETMWPSFPSQWRNLKQWSRKQVGQSNVSQETSGQQEAGNKQSASQHYRIVPINLCGTSPRITRQFVTISSWWQRCFNNTMSSAMWPSANAMYSRGDTASQCFRSWLATTIGWQSRSWTILAVLYYKGYNVLQLAQRWTWANGYVWAYAMPINVNNAMDAHDQNNENPVLTALSQGVHNGGNHAWREFPKTIRARVVEYYVNTNSALLPSNLLPEENLGHPDHVQHVMTRNNLVDGEQEEQQDEAQDDDQDGGNNDDNDGDDAMVGKKRRVDNWDQQCQQWIQLLQDGTMLQQSAKWDTRHPQYRTTSQ